MKNDLIGIFDSGLGGLSVFLNLKKLLPEENFIYLADQKNCPYGRKNRKEIKELSLKNIQFLLKKDCKLIVIACNTVTTAAIGFLRNKFPEIPFVGVVPPVKTAAEKTKTEHIVALSTKATQKSSYLKRLINKFAKDKKVYNLSCPGLVEIIEKGEFGGRKARLLLKECLRMALKDKKVDVVVTGCTHYPFAKKSILNLFTQRVKFIEPSLAVSQQTKRVLTEKNILSRKRKADRFFTTSDPKFFEIAFKKLLGFKIKAEKVKL